MLRVLNVLSARIKHQKRKLYRRPRHKQTHFACNWFSMPASKGRDQADHARACATTLTED